MSDDERAGEGTEARARLIDLADHPSNTAELRSALRLANLVLQSSEDGILAFDREVRYTLWNPGMERISGMTAAEVLGSRAFEVFPFLIETGQDHFFFEALAGRKSVTPDTPYSVPETGRSGFFEGIYSPLLGDDDEVVGGLAIIRDVTERREIISMKDRFIADAAHELRTPIGILGGFAALLSESRYDLTAESTRAAIESIVSQTERMRTLVDDLLDLSRLEQRRLPLEIQPVGVRSLVDNALTLTPPPDDVVLEQQIDPKAAVLADAGKLQQAVTNLLTNSYKYGGKTVKLDAERDGGRVRLRIADDGPGVPTEMVDRLFEPFSRGANAAGISGSGLGLAIVRSIVEACGGTVVYEQSRAGAGFLLLLPAA
jgi:PAS domain S-box-containing protein